MIRDPDVLLAVIGQMKVQFGTQIAELNDALAVANVGIAQRDQMIAEKDAEIARLNTPAEPRDMAQQDADRHKVVNLSAAAE